MSERNWPRFFWNACVAIVAIAAIATVLPAATLGWRDRGWTGLVIQRGTGIVTAVDAGSPGAAAGVRAGDRIASSSLGTGDIIRLETPMPGYAFRFDVVRGDAHVPVALTAVDRPTAYAPLHRVLIVTEVLSFVAFIAIGAFLAALRPGPMTLWLLAFCIGTAPLDAVLPFYAGLPPPWLTIVFVCARTFLSGFSALPLLPFVLRFPNDVATGWRRRWYAAAVIACVAGTIYYFVLAVLVATEFVPLWRAYNDVPAVLAFGAGIAVLLTGLYERHGADRERQRWAVVGTAIGFAALVLDYLPRVPATVYPVANTLAVVMPIAIAYAVFRQRLIDVRFFINRAAVYTIITFALLVTIGVAEWLISRIVDEQHLLAYLTAAVSVGVGIAFNRLHEQSESFVERVIFQARFRAEERLGVIARGLRFAGTFRAIDEALASDALREMRLRWAAVYRRDADDGTCAYACVATAGACPATPPVAADGTIVRSLRSELRTIPVAELEALAIPILSGQDLLGFTLYATHRDGADIDPVELHVLEALCASAATAYANVDAANYREEVTGLRRRLTELETATLRGAIKS